ncbi:MAG: ABC transporter substrate-binding protein [Janthinobacterium lividum]
MNLTRRNLLGSVALAGLVVPPFARLAHADEAPVKGGTLTLVMYPEPPYLLSAVDPTLQMAVVTTKMTEGLLWYDLAMKPHPQLALSWEVAADGLSWTFHLRSGVKWHDGQDFTSADVAYSLGVWKARHARGRQSFQKVTDVETPDPLTVIIHLSAPSPQLATVWSAYESPVIPKHVFDGTDLLANKAAAAPVGTGPFRFKEWARGDHLIMERNPDYWDEGKPNLDRIVFRFIADAGSRTAALESGEAQIGPLTPVPLSDIARLTAGKDLVATIDGYDYMAPVLLMQINTRKAPLDQRAVRQAIAFAINRDALTKTVWFGFGKPANGPIPSVVKAWYTTDGVPAYPYDPKKAEALLDEAGLKRGADGKRFKMQTDAYPGGAEFTRTAEFIKQQLGRVGIEVEIRTSDLPSYVRRIYGEYDFDTSPMYNGAFPDPSAGIQRMYWSKAAQKGVPFVNPTGYADPAVDHDFEDAQTQNDPKKRWDDYADLQRRVMTDLSVIPLMEMRFVTVANRRVRNHTVSADGLIGSNFATVWLAPAAG